jgi:hypothetical protein
MVDDPELSKEIVYWVMASNFGFTPEEVDAIPEDRVMYMIILEMEKKKKEAEAMGGGNSMRRPRRR